MANFTTFLPPTSEQQVTAFERKNGLMLPADYRKFLLRHNGGRPAPDGSWIPKLRKGILVGDLLGITEGQKLSLQYVLDEYRVEIPDGCLIIGYDPGAAMFILGTRPPVTGVYFWDHQHRFPGSSTEEGNTYWLADSFQEWIEALREC
jgi:hypothetical protein